MDPDSNQVAEGPRASEVFREWLSGPGTVDVAGLEALCREHPDLEAALRELHEVYRLGLSVSSSRTFQETIQERLGEDVENLTVTLSPASSGRDPESRTRPESPGTPSLSGPIQLSGRYRSDGEIARGGMGIIYKIHDRDLSRELAMKVLQATPGDTAPGGDSDRGRSLPLARFLEEAQVTAQLDHPGIIPVHDLGFDDEGRVYFTMRLVKGRDLSDVFELAQRELEGWNFSRVVGVLIKACQAVAYAHQKGVIHRDLKPQNLMAGRFGEVYVMDWGLAKVTGKKDLHDIRLVPTAELTFKSIQSERRDSGGDGAESPLMTLDGAVVGTPAFMAPEQARGQVELVDQKADIYSLGAILYTLLAGHPPYVEPGTRISPRTVLGLVTQGPPRPLESGKRRAPAELVAICEKAMAREREERYATSLDLAEDLQAWIDGRVVKAYRSGPVAEARKWVSRNRALAFSVGVAGLLLLVGLVTTVLLQKKAHDDLEEAHGLAESRLEDVLRLSDIKRLGDLREAARQLWPAVPEKVDSMALWLEEARALVGRLPRHRAALESLRQSALPRDEKQRQADRRAHPRFEELERRKGELADLEAELRKLRQELGGPARATHLPAPPGDRRTLTTHFRHLFEVSPEIAGGPGRLTVWADDGVVIWLNGQEISRLRVPPGADSGDGSELPATESVKTLRPVSIELEPGSMREGRNLLAARLHQENPGSRDAYFSLELGVGASTLIAEGASWRHATSAPPGATWRELDHDDSDWARGPSPLGYGFESGFPEGRLAELPSLIAGLDREIAELEAELDGHRTWSFDETEDRWQHDSLRDLVEGLESFEGGEMVRVSERHEFARTVVERSFREPADRWQEALASIRNPQESPAYRGLEIEPQLGLVPIGRDPRSGLWEFAHLETGTPVRRQESGELLLEDESGIVFVLLPGGTFTMGARRAEPGATFSAGSPPRVTGIEEDSLASRLGLEVGDAVLEVDGSEVPDAEALGRHVAAIRTGETLRVRVRRAGAERQLEVRVPGSIDPLAEEAESPVHEVILEPFFLSKFEMTQGQWQRVTGENPSYYRAGLWSSNRRVTPRNPVELVTREVAGQVVARLGLELPTEAQMEYAIRGGTLTPWWSGHRVEDLRGNANLADLSVRRGGARWDIEPSLDDGHLGHAPAGTFSPNPLGLHDVSGNVMEWCREKFAAYSRPVQAGTGERIDPGATIHVARGGSFAHRASVARSAFRYTTNPAFRSITVGLRPARPVEGRPGR